MSNAQIAQLQRRLALHEEAVLGIAVIARRSPNSARCAAILARLEKLKEELREN